ncbi:MAG: energy transducer TonB [Longimicrobiales bacterium]|nr:energy transducer TonB [Longimicrobiales bacterium]
MKSLHRSRPFALILMPFLAACAGEQQIQRPSPLFQNIPIEYPLDLWDQGVEGETLVRVRVSETGTVTEVEILESSGWAAFDSAAVVGARQLRFDPARRNGRRIEVWARVPILFSRRPRGGGNL